MFIGYIGFEVGGSVTSLGTGSTILYDCEEVLYIHCIGQVACLAIFGRTGFTDFQFSVELVCQF